MNSYWPAAASTQTPSCASWEERLQVNVLQSQRGISRNSLKYRFQLHCWMFSFRAVSCDQDGYANANRLQLNVTSAWSYLHFCLKIHEKSVDHFWFVHDQVQVAIKTKLCMATAYSQGEFICFYRPIHYKRLYYNIPLLKKINLTCNYDS